jgi:hypothetical protein
VSGSVEFGLPGLGLAPGDHLCAFYMGQEERDEFLLPYLRAGLHAGDKCICVVDATEPAVVLGRIGDGIDVDGCVAAHQLDLRASTDAYLRSGRFSTGEMMEFWNESIGTAMSGGTFDFARSVGEMTWALRDMPGVEELVGYESELNRFMPRYPQVILCLYDLGRFGGGILVDMLKTHPKVLLGGMVLDNPHYLSPDEFLATRA